MNKKTFTYKDKAEQSYFEYLDKLRASGITNMYRAGPYLFNEFYQISMNQSQIVLAKWMETFEERGCPGREEDCD